MKIAVITPYYDENYEILKRCHDSVASQDYDKITHIFVADGLPHPSINKIFQDSKHLILPTRHCDAGATPRAIGALSAFSQGYDAVAFLDADNTFCPLHISTMVSAMCSNVADVVTATRNICTNNGEIMYVDNIESNGNDFCDTNCMFIGKKSLNLLTYWITDPSYRLWSDRNFWAAVIHSNLKRHHVSFATVNYHSKWAWHYQQAGRMPPDDSVWIDKTEDGELVHKKHSQI